MQWVVLIGVLFVCSPAPCDSQVARIDHNFRLEDFDRNGDGYKITIRNESNSAFSNFLVVILGEDISGVTVYRSEFPVEFMEGKSDLSFFVPGYDERIFEVKMRILTPDYEVLLR